MNASELTEEVRFELRQMERIVQELEALDTDVGEGPATLREEAAAGQFLASFYMGVENVLKRMARYHQVELPQSEQWHVELFRWFCRANEHRPPLPVLFPEPLASEMKAYRRFRHVVHHAYGIELKWERMVEGIQNVRPVFDRFRRQVEGVLAHLG